MSIEQQRCSEPGCDRTVHAGAARCAPHEIEHLRSWLKALRADRLKVQPELDALLQRLRDVHPDDLPASLRRLRAAWLRAGAPITLHLHLDDSAPVKPDIETEQDTSLHAIETLQAEVMKLRGRLRFAEDTIAAAVEKLGDLGHD